MLSATPARQTPTLSRKLPDVSWEATTPARPLPPQQTTHSGMSRTVMTTEEEIGVTSRGEEARRAADNNQEARAKAEGRASVPINKAGTATMGADQVEEADPGAGAPDTDPAHPPAMTERETGTLTKTHTTTGQRQDQTLARSLHRHQCSLRRTHQPWCRPMSRPAPCPRARPMFRRHKNRLPPLPAPPNRYSTHHPHLCKCWNSKCTPCLSN